MKVAVIFGDLFDGGRKRGILRPRHSSFAGTFRRAHTMTSIAALAAAGLFSAVDQPLLDVLPVVLVFNPTVSNSLRMSTARAANSDLGINRVDE